MTRHSDTTCPWCLHKHELVSGVMALKDGEKKPDKEPVHSDGDASFCVGCGEFSIFDSKATGGLRFPTKEEFAELAGMTEVIGIRLTYSQVNPRRRRILHRPEWRQ